jgi:hypothetical protein
MVKFPNLKKNIASFLLEEEGSISKKAALALGAVLAGSIALANQATAQHNQNIAHSDSSSLSWSGGTITATHAHYDPSHSSHGSHGSHSSHSSHSSY